MRRATLSALALALTLAAVCAPESYTLDRAARTGSLELTVETASLSAGDRNRGSPARARDEHLRHADFFNVAAFPRMTFRAAEARFIGDEIRLYVEFEGYRAQGARLARSRDSSAGKR